MTDPTTIQWHRERHGRDPHPRCGFMIDPACRCTCARELAHDARRRAAQAEADREHLARRHRDRHGVGPHPRCAELVPGVRGCTCEREIQLSRLARQAAPLTDSQAEALPRLLAQARAEGEA